MNVAVSTSLNAISTSYKSYSTKEKSTEAYLELCQTSKMDHYAKAVNYFHKKLHLRCLTVF